MGDVKQEKVEDILPVKDNIISTEIEAETEEVKTDIKLIEKEHAVEQAEDNIVEGEDKPEMTEDTMPVEEVIAVQIDGQAVEEINEVQQTEQEYVIVEKEVLSTEEETPSLDEDENKESIEFIEKEDLIPAVEEKEIKTEIESKMEDKIEEVKSVNSEQAKVDEPKSEVLHHEENTTSEDLTKLDKKEDIVPVEVTIAEIESKVEVDVKSMEEIEDIEFISEENVDVEETKEEVLSTDEKN